MDYTHQICFIYLFLQFLALLETSVSFLVESLEIQLKICLT